MKLTFEQDTILRRVERGWDPRTTKIASIQRTMEELQLLNLVTDEGTLAPWGRQYIADHDARSDALPSAVIPGLNA